MNNTPNSNRVHIGIFGKCNAGKSSVINAITAQSTALVSDVSGTTTDPVSKAMELLPFGPVLITDTAGIDDESELGELRIKKSKQVLDKCHFALYIVDSAQGLDAKDEAFLSFIKSKSVPFIVVYNNVDLLKEGTKLPDEALLISSKTGENVDRLKELMSDIMEKTSRQNEHDFPIIKDLIEAGDVVVLVTPIDEGAPKGRMILPQQQTIRDVLDADGIAFVTKENNLREYISKLAEKPKMVVTDSQVFALVADQLDDDVTLTSFSILFARHKGILKDTLTGIAQLKNLKDGDKVLIAEGCTHHRQCSDIGSVKLPKWISNYTGKDLTYSFMSGVDFPEELEDYALVVHCGGCMLNDKVVKNRLKTSLGKGVAMTNYGLIIAEMHGVLKRSIEPFDDLKGII